MFTKYIIIFIFVISFAHSQTVTLTAEEKELYNLTMEYRKKNHLESIPLSKSLTLVAQTHVQNLQDYHRLDTDCNLHSWYGNGKWKNVCFDGSEFESMWSKPSELTNYKGHGYEVSAYFSGDISAEIALQLWKESYFHRIMLLNQAEWKNIQFKAIGIGISKNYAVIWVGEQIDVEGEPN